MPSELSAFAITRKWPPRHPERLQLYSVPTPNGVKVSIMLEETALPYEPHLVDFATNEQASAEFRSVNPYGKIPAILDPDGPGGHPLPLFESGAILIYLAERTGRFLPRDAAARYQTLQWLMFQMGGIGPMFGQLGFFHKFAGKDYEDKRPRDRYVAEARRLLGGPRCAPRNRRLADGRGLYDCRHGRLSLGAQPRRFLRRRGTGGFCRICPRWPRARGLRGASGRRTRADHSRARLTAECRKKRPRRTGGV